MYKEIVEDQEKVVNEAWAIWQQTYKAEEDANEDKANKKYQYWEVVCDLQ